MNLDESVTEWVLNLQRGDSRAASELWRRYFQQLVRLIENRLPTGVARDFDGEDIALSAIHSLFSGIHNDRFPDLHDRNNVWSLLIVITARKTANRLRDGVAQKRGGGQVKGHSAFGMDENGPGIHQIIGTEPTPEFSLEVAEQCELLINALPNDHVRDVAKAKLEGLTNDEIANRMNCGLRTIERRTALIRTVWEAYADGLMG